MKICHKLAGVVVLNAICVLCFVCGQRVCQNNARVVCYGAGCALHAGARGAVALASNYTSAYTPRLIHTPRVHVQINTTTSMHSAPTAARILLLTAMTEDKLGESQPATNSKQCYALRHGYTFIVETNKEIATSINPWWIKTFALQKYLPHFDWVVWLDADCLVSNAEVKLEWFLDDATADLVLTDHNFSVNNGVLAMRNTPWSAQFLASWIAAGRAVHAAHLRWWQDDQGALFHMLLAEAAGPTRPYDGHCASKQNCCSDVLERCFRDGMVEAGHPYLHRRLRKVRFISPTAHLVVATGVSMRGGFVMYRRQDLPSWVTHAWFEENFYHAGDFVTHVGGPRKAATIAALVPSGMRLACEGVYT